MGHGFHFGHGFALGSIAVVCIAQGIDRGFPAGRICRSGKEVLAWASIDAAVSELSSR